MVAALEFLQAYEREVSSLIGRIVTGDETWVHCSTPESKQQSMAWCEPGEPASKKAKVGHSANKIMATVFLDAEGVLIKYHSKGHNVNQQTYQATLKKLRAAIRRLHPGLRDEIFLIHDNARPHTVASVQELLRTFHWCIFGHLVYSPDLAPSDFFLFPQLKRTLRGKCFRSDEEVKHAVNSFLRKQSTKFYRMGLEGIVTCHCKCLDSAGNYVEK